MLTQPQVQRWHLANESAQTTADTQHSRQRCVRAYAYVTVVIIITSVTLIIA